MLFRGPVTKLFAVFTDNQPVTVKPLRKERFCLTEVYFE